MPSPVAVMASIIIGVEIKVLGDMTNRAFTAVAPQSDNSGFQKLLQDGAHLLVYGENVQTFVRGLGNVPSCKAAKA